jgi:hypothetical protein
VCQHAFPLLFKGFYFTACMFTWYRYLFSYVTQIVCWHSFVSYSLISFSEFCVLYSWVFFIAASLQSIHLVCETLLLTDSQENVACQTSSQFVFCVCVDINVEAAQTKQYGAVWRADYSEARARNELKHALMGTTISLLIQVLRNREIHCLTSFCIEYKYEYLPLSKPCDLVRGK